MKWKRVKRSEHLSDRRAGGGLPGGLPLGAGLGLPGILIVLALIFFGGGLPGGSGSGFPVDVPLDQFPQAPGASGEPLPGAPDAEAEEVEFVNFVFSDLQRFWNDSFKEAGRRYRPAEIVLFRQATQTGCGVGSSQTGPFYCPLDETMYIDLSFYDELTQRFGAPGDFAQAYVIAHEMGHHVQNQLGIDDEVRRLAQERPDDANELSVRQELQADCLAGVWAHSTYERGMLERGDLEEGLGAAAAIGDDRIQQQSGGRVNPETWTHGSSEQRATWLRRGFDSGDSDDCDTFAGDV